MTDLNANTLHQGSPAILQRAGAVAHLILNRPHRMNALGAVGDGDIFRGLCDTINRDPAIRCVILMGAGRCFSAGGDLKEMADEAGAFSGSPAEIRQQYRDNIHHIVRSIDDLEVPVIAAVHGAAIGLGADIACLADIRIAAHDAVFGATFLRLGLIPGDGGAWFLPRTIGMSRAAELLFGGETIDAQRALDWGLVSSVVSPDRLEAGAGELADKIVRMSGFALRQTKRLLRQGRTSTRDDALEAAAAAQALAHLSPEHAERLAVISRASQRS